jgi:hypothetical protein
MLLKNIKFILLSSLTARAEEVIYDHRYVFRSNRLPTDNIFCIWQILKEKWEYIELGHQILIGFKNAYDAVRIEGLYYNFIELLIAMKLVSLKKVCPNETYNKM